jgi:hypothetical protein
MAEVKRIIKDSEVTKEDDSQWPEADRCVSTRGVSLNPKFMNLLHPQIV